jgi:hypothetical protein
MRSLINVNETATSRPAAATAIIGKLMLLYRAFQKDALKFTRLHPPNHTLYANDLQVI